MHLTNCITQNNTSHPLISSSLTKAETNSSCVQRTDLSVRAWGRTGNCCRVQAHSTAPRPPQPQLLTSKPLPAGLDLALAVPCRTPGSSGGVSRAPEELGAPASRPYPQHPATTLRPRLASATAPGLLSPQEMPCTAPASPLISALLPRKAQRARDRNFPSSTSDFFLSEVEKTGLRAAFIHEPGILFNVPCHAGSKIQSST